MYVFTANLFHYDKAIIETWVVSIIIGPYGFAHKSSVISTHFMTTYGRGGGDLQPQSFLTTWRKVVSCSSCLPHSRRNSSRDSLRGRFCSSLSSQVPDDRDRDGPRNLMLVSPCIIDTILKTTD